MQDILDKINKVRGVRGTLVIEAGGLIVAGSMARGEDEEGLCAVVSTIIASLRGALEKLGKGELTRFTLHCSEGSVVIFAAGKVYVIVLLDGDTNLGLVLVELRDAVQELAAKMDMQ